MIQNFIITEDNCFMPTGRWGSSDLLGKVNPSYVFQSFFRLYILLRFLRLEWYSSLKWILIS